MSLFAHQPLSAIVVLSGLLLSACGGGSSSGSSSSEVSQQTLTLNLNNTRYTAIQLDNGDWQALKAPGVKYPATALNATVISVCNNDVLLQKRTLAEWRANPSVNSSCQPEASSNIRNVTLQAPANTEICSIAVAGGSGKLNGAATEFSARLTAENPFLSAAYAKDCFAINDPVFFLHTSLAGLGNGYSFDLSSRSTEIRWLNDADERHGALYYFNKNGVRFEMAPFTDSQRYGLTDELSKDGSFEHSWQNGNNTQSRRMFSPTFNTTLPEFVDHNDLTSAASVAQDGKTLTVTIPQIKQPDWNFSGIFASASFSDKSSSTRLSIEISPDACGDTNCSVSFESPNTLPEFNAQTNPTAALVTHLSGNSSLRWKARFQQQRGDINDTVELSDKSLF